MDQLILPLPPDRDLDIPHLVTTLGNTTQCYKFVWFLGILRVLNRHLAAISEPGALTLTYPEILSEVLRAVRPLILEFKLSLGLNDCLTALVLRLEELAPEKKGRGSLAQDDLLSTLTWLHETDKVVRDNVKAFVKYVPHRFLSPWIGTSDKDRIRAFAPGFDDGRPYRLSQSSAGQLMVEVNPDWLYYLSHNFSILEGYCLGLMGTFLEKRNPLVPNILSKLQWDGKKRHSLKTQQRWFAAYLRDHTYTCIYSGQPLTSKDQYALDLFIPWSFTGSDETWNLLPIAPSLNSQKSNYLPPLNNGQIAALAHFEMAVLRHNCALPPAERKLICRESLLDDFRMLFKEQEIKNILALTEGRILKTFDDTLRTWHTVALNQGFLPWQYAEESDRSPAVAVKMAKPIPRLSQGS